MKPSFGHNTGQGNTAKFLFEAPMEWIENGPVVSCCMVKQAGLSQVDHLLKNQR